MVVWGEELFLMSEVPLYSQVDMLRVRYNSVNVGAGQSPVEQNGDLHAPNFFSFASDLANEEHRTQAYYYYLRILVYFLT